jgi:tetratricopeptide (TPR) repeat protein/O-antigen ligase
LLTRLGYYADKLLEMGWLWAAVAVPLFFNVYSSRVFEPDKIAMIVRSTATIMVVLWLIKLIEGGWSAASRSDAPTRMGRASAAMQGAAERGLPPWLGFLRVPMVVPILVYALVYLFSSILTMTPDATWWGSYQRLQGFYSQISYMTLGLAIIGNMRTRKQAERLVNFIILTSIPVAFYGLLQANRLDPLPWAGDTATRVASSMGNAIFVAAWLIMAVPYTLYRFFVGTSEMLAARNAAYEEVEVVEDGRRRPARRPVYFGPDYGWALIANVVGILLVSLFVFMAMLRIVAGLAFPDAAFWWAVPFALVVFYLTCWGIEWLASRRDDPLQKTYLAIIGGLMFFTGIFGLALKWSTKDGQSAQIEFQGDGFFWILFFLLGWGAIAGLAYSFGGTYEENQGRRFGLFPVVLNLCYEIIFVIVADRDNPLRGVMWALFFTFAWGALTALAYFFGEQSEENADPRRGIVALASNTGYALLIGVQLLCIYLTQSRGPWLGIGMGILVFAAALFFVGRNRDVRWMARTGGIVSSIALAIALPIIALNIFTNTLNVGLPTAITELPVVGRAIDRLSTLTRTEDGTGKVRTLIWQGATALIASDPARAVIGYGPEAMYVVYNKFYPAELAHWELRNATPDRSHNVEFDHVVSMGVIGLAAYYFIIAAFYWYGLRILKRARNTRDLLLGIALISALTAHFIEIQTGIQIASTWTYFYLTIGLMIAFGYNITGYLREDGVGGLEPALANGRATATDGAANGGSVAQAELKQTVLASGAAPRKGTVVAAADPKDGNTRAATTTVASTARKAGQPATTATAPGRGGRPTTPMTGGRGSGQGQGPDARRRPPQGQNVRIQSGASEEDWSRNPAMLIIYAVLALAALAFIWTVNVATVQADTYYKQGQAFDGAGIYLSNDDRNSIAKYDKAIALQPNQDYYYLFRGRAYLEFSKTVDEQLKDSTQEVKDQNRTRFLQLAEASLTRARDLNPMNTDHYANLGRLYLYWSDNQGGRDPSKSGLSVQNFEFAVEHSPGNAGLYDELAVAYSRNNQFDKAAATLRQSQQVDNLYARTPFILGQLLQDRATAVKDAITTGAPLPTGGETDYNKLLIQAGQAFSDSISLDPAFFVDNGMQGRVDYMLEATQPFTDVKHGTVIDTSPARNVMTDTIAMAYQQLIPVNEKKLADALRARGVYNGQDNLVPATVLSDLWARQDWADVRPAEYTKSWIDNEIQTLARNAVVPYAALGYIKFKLYNPASNVLTPERQQLLAEATANYDRAVALDPSNYFNQKNLGSLYVERAQHELNAKQCAPALQTLDLGLLHLTAALTVVEAQPDVDQDATKKQDHDQIRNDVASAQNLKTKPCP